jgi:hypothetical protein
VRFLQRVAQRVYQSLQLFGDAFVQALLVAAQVRQSFAGGVQHLARRRDALCNLLLQRVQGVQAFGVAGEMRVSLGAGQQVAFVEARGLQQALDAQQFVGANDAPFGGFLQCGAWLEPAHRGRRLALQQAHGVVCLLQAQGNQRLVAA